MLYFRNYKIGVRPVLCNNASYFRLDDIERVISGEQQWP